MKPSQIVDQDFLHRVVFQTTPLGPNGEQETGLPRSPVSVSGIIGNPEGRARGNVGDVLIRIDVPQIWQKLSGMQTKDGWGLLPDGGGVGPVGPQGEFGPQGPIGTSDAFDNILRNIPAAALNGARAPVGIPAAISGTPSAPQPTPTTALTSLQRTRYTTGIGAGLPAALRSALGLWWRGNAAGLGGFDVRWPFGLASFAAGYRAFVGFRALAALIPNVDPSTLVNIIGIGLNAGDTQWSLMHNDAADAATVVPLGPQFDVAVDALLQVRISADPNAASVDWEVRNLESGATASGSLAADIPAATVFLSSHVWANTGTDATTALMLDVGEIPAETPTPTP